MTYASTILYTLAWIMYAPIFGHSWAYDVILEYHTDRSQKKKTAVFALLTYYVCAFFAIPSMILICVCGLNIAKYTRIQDRK